MATKLPSIPGPSGYLLVPLRESADFTLYRGRQKDNSSAVLAVALAEVHESPQGLRRLEHEYSLVAELDSAWAAKPLALTRHEGRTILILEDHGGDPLDRILRRDQGQPLDLKRFLRIAIGLATAVGRVHRQGLIHKDIKPANVLVDDVGNVWLTGFGIASQLKYERQAPAPPEFIAGTLAYMAPEQTGRMNRSIDTRSDLYSLGVTLYQMLTGELPFVAADAMEWVHCHIARQPTPPDRSVFPAPLSALILRLLAKTVEERYQTAAGLEADLRKCLVEWETQGHIDPFPLGSQDLPDRLLIPEKLYGRERETDALLAAFDRVVAQGTPELVLVSGYSGVGKSSMVNELHKALVPPRGLFAMGKFDQYKRDIPYATVAQAFQTLVRQILARSEAEVNQWRDALREALGPNGQLIENLVPQLAFVIGKQPPVPDLPPRDAENRFQLVFRRFLGVFARPEHPLTLFLDDLQWLDTATLDLFQTLITHPEVHHLLMVGAYRDNEVGLTHPLMRTLEAIRGTHARVQEIVLAPLGLDDVGRLVSDALHCEGDSGHPLATLVHEKTGGNPFFAIQFLTALAEEGLLRLDLDAAAWIWDVARIRAKGYTDNVVDLIVGKLKRLSGATQTALQQLACLGNVVEFATLTLVYGESEKEIHASLLEAARTGLILCLEGSYAFLHDRIQEAAYTLIPEGERAGAHLRIGRVLLASMTTEGLAEHLFDVANQLNRGAALLIDRYEKAQVATIDLGAGRKAKTSAAYASASVYLATGMALLDDSDWRSQYKLMFSLWLERAECEFLNGNFEQAEQIIAELLQRGASKVDQAAAYHLKVVLHIVKSENQQAVATGLTCLRLFGIEIPTHPTWEQVDAEYKTLWRNLDSRSIEDLINLPLMTDPELQAAMRPLLVLANAASFTDFHLFCLLLCRMVNISVQHGTSGVSANAFGFLGFTLGPLFHHYREGYRFAKLGCDLVEKHGFISRQAKAYSAMGAVAVWTQPIAGAIDFTRTAFHTAIETGDLTFACYSMFTVVSHLLIRNDPLDAVWRESEVGLDFARKAKFRDIVDLIVSQQRFIATMQGWTAAFSTFNDAHFDEATFEAQLTGDRTSLMISWYWILKLKARYLSGNYVEALAAADKAKPLLPAATGQIQLIDYHFYDALTVLALYEKGSTDDQIGWRDLLTAHREQLREWAENYPPTFADKHALVSAEIARIEGRDRDSMRLYEQAIHLAHVNGFVQNEALAHEVTAQFYVARGVETNADTHLRNARNCYNRWGALGKVKQLDERYPQLREERVPASTTATIGTPVGQLDVETVVRASQAFLSEIVLPKLIEKLMRIVLEHAGAERGLLILLRGNEPRIEAEAITGHGEIEVTARQTATSPIDLPESVLQYVIRTREPVVIDDASIGNSYSEDEFLREKRPRSILCLPIVKQMTLIGALYLENNLTPSAFTADRVAVLELLASQAAISLENARLYSDLQHSEAYLAQGQSVSHTGSFGWSVVSGEIYFSEETYKIFALDRAVEPTLDLIFQRIHPDDRDIVHQSLSRATNEKEDFDYEHRLLMPDGSIKHLHVIGHASKASSGDLEFVGVVRDITAEKQAGEALRRSENYLAEAQRLTHTGSGVWSVPGWDALYLSDEWYRIYGFDPRQGLSAWKDRLQRIHPEDRAKVQEAKDRATREKSEYEVDHRIVLSNGTVKYTHTVGHPVLNASGDVEQFVCTMMDVTERAQAEEALRKAFEEIKGLRDQLYRENLALRQEIDQSSMFEEIVGTSPVLRAVLSRISKVAPTNSTVLITGETGTGKELIARAVHKRSQRSSRAFVSVNCAAIPRELIASELFGHEKGAFTGAIQRRLGRFEMAEGGTIFLDEVGELPAETQIALLRVLQEHEFERVGGTASIKNDVRVIAATNRDLEAAIAARTFRSDLFYRLNVFPIEIPSLRERREDIPLLVEYFIDRFARKAGKMFQAVNKKSLDLLESYPWPGNIRELQNVIERSVIVCETDNFSVDECWLSRRPVSTEPDTRLGLSRKPSFQEKAIIEAALAECGGQVSGPSGAATKLGIPGSTLESKIKLLKIDKNRFKTADP